MRFVCTSDTHTYQNKLTLPEGDVLLCAGDITFTGHFPDLIKFNKWLGEQDYAYKIFIAGNHDKTFQSHASYAESLINNGIYLRDEMTEVEGIKIWGAPWQPTFGHGWAFNEDRCLIKAKWDLIPNETDILITHGPPLGHGDEVKASYSSNKGEKVGCYDLKEALKRVKPKVHVFGHIHEGYGITRLKHEEHTIHCINASLCTEHYSPINKPIVFDYDKETGEITFPGPT